MNAEIIRKKLLHSNITLVCVDSVGSTNDVAKALAREGAPEGLVIAAESQSAGKGTRGRHFYSPGKSGIYLSLLIRPDLCVTDTLKLTCLAAVAVVNTIERICFKQAEIKWVNDIMMKGKKVCGILCEGSFGANNGQGFAVIGFGINMLPPPTGFPKEISEIAGSVFENDEAVCTRELFTAELINEFFRLYRGKANTFKAYRKHCRSIGRRIILPDSDNGEAYVEDIDESYRLLVRCSDNTLKHINSASASICYLD